MSRHLAVIVLFSLLCLPLRAEDSGLSDAERLRALENDVRQLKQRNDELESEMREIKAKRSPFAPVVSKSEAKAKTSSDSKSVVFAEPAPPPVDVHPGGSEYKLTLGGYIQANLEAGDVSAFEGRFGLTQLQNRFRLRRARVTLTGDFAEQFEFTVQGDFEQPRPNTSLSRQAKRSLIREARHQVRARSIVRLCSSSFSSSSPSSSSSWRG